MVGALSAYWAHLQAYYDYGAASAKVRPWLTSVGQAPWRQLRDWLANPRPPEFTGLKAAGCGLAMVTFLGLARQRLVWWPFHPVGYALGYTPSMDYMWMPFLIAWLLKAAVLRFGGIPLYRRSVPFFLGLILGDYVIPGFWFLFGAVTHTQMYLSFPH